MFYKRRPIKDGRQIFEKIRDGPRFSEKFNRQFVRDYRHKLEAGTDLPHFFFIHKSFQNEKLNYSLSKYA